MMDFYLQCMCAYNACQPLTPTHENSGPCFENNRYISLTGRTLPPYADCSQSLLACYMRGLFCGLHIDHTYMCTQLPQIIIPNREDEAINFC